MNPSRSSGRPEPSQFKISAWNSVKFGWARPDSLAEETDLVPVERRTAAAIYEASVSARESGDRHILGVVPERSCAEHDAALFQIALEGEMFFQRGSE